MLYTANCLITEICKFAKDRGIADFEIVLLDIKVILFEFEWGTVFPKLVTVTAECFVDWLLLLKLYGVYTRCTSMKCGFQTTDGAVQWWSSLCYKDLTLCHFVVSSTSVRCPRVINWKSVHRVVLMCSICWNLYQTKNTCEHH